MVRGARGRSLGRGGRQLFGPRQARRRADRPQPHRPRQARDQVPCRRRDRRPAAGRRPLGRQRPRHAPLPASSAPGPERRRRHRQAVRRRGLRQRREPRPLPQARHPAPYPQDRRGARLGTGQDPLRGRARLRMVAGQQETGPAAGPARPRDPGPPDRRVHLHRRQPYQWLLKTVPKEDALTKRLKIYIENYTAPQRGLLGMWAAENIIGELNPTTGEMIEERWTDIAYGWNDQNRDLNLVFE